MAVSQPPVTGAPSPPAGALSAERWERLAPLTGVVSIVLLIVGGIILDGTREPADAAPAAAYLAFFDREMDTIYFGTLVLMLGVVFFVWFAGALRARLAAAEGGTNRLSTLAFGGAAMVGVLMLAAMGTMISGAFAVDEDIALTPDAAQALYFIGDGLFYVAFFPAAVLLMASALVMLRTHVLPVWLGWASFAMGIILVVPWVGWAAFIFLVPIWIVLVSVLLYRKNLA